MKALLDHLAALATRIAANETLLKVAQRRHHNMRRRAEARWDRVAEAGAEAEAEGTSQESRKILRLLRRAKKAQARSRFWVERIKRQHQRIDHLEVTKETVREELKDWRKEHGIRFIGENKVRGEGVPAWKLQKAAMLRCEANYLKGTQPGYYSQEGGARDYTHALYRYPHGLIWDCSTWNDGINFACGLESPSGHEYLLGGYTATELAESKVVTRAELRPAGDFIVYLRYPGDTIGHHVERILDRDNEITMGHGDSAIDRNSRFDIFGDGLYVFRRRDDLCPRLN